MNIKKIINNFLSNYNYKIVNNSNYQKNLNLLKKANKVNDDLNFRILCQFSKNRLKLKNTVKYSKSQSLQDLFVLSCLNFKKKGFFVEIGAADGVYISNTFLLEKKFKWNGILAEPLKRFHKSLRYNRSAKIVTDLVYSVSNKKLLFREVPNSENSSVLFSTIDHFSSNDLHSKSRNKGKLYRLNTISLNDLLTKYRSTHVIDYLSIDTEGSEYEILKSVNFKKYIFKVITCEHNYTKNRDKIYKLLTSNGYKRVLKEISKEDDWYIYVKKF